MTQNIYSQCELRKCKTHYYPRYDALDGRSRVLGQVVEDVVTEEIPDVDQSETSSIRSGVSETRDYASPTSMTSPAELASPSDSVTSHSSLRVYTDTVEGEPQVWNAVSVSESYLVVVMPKYLDS